MVRAAHAVDTSSPRGEAEPDRSPGSRPMHRPQQAQRPRHAYHLRQGGARLAQRRNKQIIVCGFGQDDRPWLAIDGTVARDLGVTQEAGHVGAVPNAPEPLGCRRIAGTSRAIEAIECGPGDALQGEDSHWINENGGPLLGTGPPSPQCFHHPEDAGWLVSRPPACRARRACRAHSEGRRVRSAFGKDRTVRCRSHLAYSAMAELFENLSIEPLFSHFANWRIHRFRAPQATFQPAPQMGTSRFSAVSPTGRILRFRAQQADFGHCCRGNIGQKQLRCGQLNITVVCGQFGKGAAPVLY